MSDSDFDSKFEKLIEILTDNSEICDKFVQFLTIEESYPFACSLVGELDFEMYEKAVKKFADDDELSGATGGTKSFNYNKIFIESLIK